MIEFLRSIRCVVFHQYHIVLRIEHPHADAR